MPFIPASAETTPTALVYRDVTSIENQLRATLFEAHDAVNSLSAVQQTSGTKAAVW